MIRTILTLAFAAATGAVGYVGGSVYPAPPVVINLVDHEANVLRTKLRVENVDLNGFRSLVSAERFKHIEGELNAASAAAGDIIVVDKDKSSPEKLQQLAVMESSAPTPIPVSAVTPTPTKPGASAAPVAGPSAAPVLTPSAVLSPTGAARVIPTLALLCPRMTITNAPKADANLQLVNFKPLVDVEGVKLASDPAPGACLSSGFGQRGNELHKGVDYHNESGGPILAAGDGAIIEIKYRDDYGNMIVIDHGHGVYTRYAHLASFSPGLSQGVSVKRGDVIGLMGNTAGYAVPIHLHYEVLEGDYNTTKASFGLTPKDVLAFPAAP